MTWITHTTLGFVLAGILGFHTGLVVLGSTAPDWFEDFFGIKEHRGITHYVWLWVLAFVLPLAFYVSGGGEWLWWLASFGLGGLSHVFLDALTLAGVPLGVGRMRVRIGGLIRTGKVSEWVLLGFLVLFLVPAQSLELKLGYNKWKEYYNQGLLDRREWEERRFRLF